EKYQTEGIERDGAKAIAHPEFIIPLAYPFPHLGKILTLLFVPFAAWFYGSPMELGDYPVFLATGLFLSFGKVTVTVPFLLDLQEIPSDIFQLFLMSSVVAGRFNDLLGGMNLLAFTAVTTCAMAGLVKVKRGTLLVALGVTLVVGGGLIVSTRTALDAWFKDDFSRDKVVAGMNLLQRQAPARILEESAPNPVPLRPGQSRLERIRERGVIRIGYYPYNLPFTYFNAREELVGFDIDMMHRLARDLRVSIEFVPFAFATMPEQLAEDHFDLAVSGILATPGRAEAMVLSEPYMNVTMAMVVRDHERREFATMDSIRGRSDLTIGVQVDNVLAATIREHLPNARVVELWSDGQFFEGPPQYLDALVTSAEGGSAWTLLYPRFSVVNPLRNQISVPLVYPLGGKDDQFDQFMEHWIELKQNDGTIGSLYEYWVLGRGAQPRQRRWSIIRNVLHWVD
ncbi:MAG: ABC transporter substrate-binding protein, partial [Alphaproteobacteria bacterium]|nr:ABC transporter substrate-binding protein [Alphaproteobacteria bacterium]